MYLGMSRTPFIEGLESAKKFICNGNFYMALNVLDELEEKYNDTEIYTLKSRIYIFNKEYDKALNELNKIEESKVFFNKTVVYLYLKDDKELKRMYYTYFLDNEKYDFNENELHTFYILKSHIMRYLSIMMFNTDSFTYDTIQIYKYSEERLLRHLLKEHPEHSYSFDKSININELYSKVKETIDEFPEDYMSVNMKQTYIIKYPSVGTNKSGEICDYIKVTTIINTTDVIEMMPTENAGNIKILNIKKEDYSKKNVKTLTGIERFNKRYNK